MKQPLIFDGNTDYVYASGVIRGLEQYILTKADYQKVLDSNPDDLAMALGELGYRGGENVAEHALDIAVAELLKLAESLARPDNAAFVSTLRLRYDFENAGTIIKEKLLEIAVPAFNSWGLWEHDDLAYQIDRVIEDQSTELSETLALAIGEAASRFKGQQNPVIIDIVLDSHYASYLQAQLPKDEFFARWFAIYADWRNVKIMARVIRNGMPREMMTTALIPGGDIDTEKFARALDMEIDSIPALFSITEYGAGLPNVIRDAMDHNPANLDIFFRSQLLDLYKYTQFCSYGLELLWAYSLIKLEEIGTLRLILRAKQARINPDKIAEVISIVME